MLRKLLALAAGKGGNVALMSAAVVSTMVIGTGVSTDLMRAYSVRSNLSAALDAAALAMGANTGLTTAQKEALAAKYMAANFVTSNGSTLGALSYDAATANQIGMNATATVPTAFLELIGINTLTVSASTQVQLTVSGVEAVLVLDNTGSMGLSNIDTLKTAAYSLLQQLFGTTSGTLNTSSTTVRVGLVPYVASVNAVPATSADVSSGGQSAIIAKLIGSSYGSNTQPNPLAFGQGDPTKWWGCVIEDHATTFAAVSSASSSYSSYSYSGLSVSSLEGALNKTSTSASAYQYIRVPTTYTSRTGTCTVGSTWPFTNDGGSAGAVLTDGVCADTYSWPPKTTTGTKSSMSAWYSGNDDGSNSGQGSDYGPNQSCPPTPVVPLTSNSAQLVTELGVTVSGGTATASNTSGLLDWHQGGTTGSLGLAWAYRVLEPSSNSGLYSGVSTSSDWNATLWKKAVVLMTDGANTFYSKQYTGYGPYSSAYGNYNTTGATTYGSYSFSGVAYNKMIEMQEMAVCDALKSHGVTIYTLFFNDGSSPGPAIGYCSGPSSTAGHPATINGSTFDYSPYTLYATNQTQLTAAFSTIGARLSNLRISQ
ncbi:MAG TPA: pilus assembly protein TadG-related protein [Candidatus Sulfotelmatobacter sp.]|nr:pilus assembly protein TadG-related protein [Candidatus Sulfotelmatobacter sp.]